MQGTSIKKKKVTEIPSLQEENEIGFDYPMYKMKTGGG